MMNAEMLKKAGVNYNAGLTRFMGDRQLYERVLSIFVHDDLPQRARAAYDSDDRDTLRRIVHEAKGSSGNADLTNVYDKACALTTLLRSEDYTDDELRVGFLCFEKTYSMMQKAIKAAMEG